MNKTLISIALIAFAAGFIWYSTDIFMIIGVMLLMIAHNMNEEDRVIRFLEKVSRR